MTLSLQVKSWWRPGWTSVLPSVLPGERSLLGREGRLLRALALPSYRPQWGLFSPLLSRLLETAQHIAGLAFLVRVRPSTPQSTPQHKHTHTYNQVVLLQMHELLRPLSITEQPTSV